MMGISGLNRHRWLGLVVVISLAAVCLGCQGKRGGPTGSINGKVTLEGKPAPAGTVVQFISNVGAATGTLAPDGTFVTMGVPVGSYKVSLVSAAANEFPSDPKAAMEMSLKGPPPDAGSGASKVPAKYLSAETSGVSFEVKEGPNDFVLDMK
jgi:hypothetical protein